MFWIVAIIAIALIIGCVKSIWDSDSIFVKIFTLCAVVAIVLAIIFWITKIELLITIIKIIGVIAVIDIAIPIIIKIFDK